MATKEENKLGGLKEEGAEGVHPPPPFHPHEMIGRLFYATGMPPKKKTMCTIS